MAIYHFSGQVISRGNGRSAINAAAYRHAARMVDSQTGQSYDYRNKGGVVHAELAIPETAPAWLKELASEFEDDPAGASEALWNRVESWEKRKDAQLAREFNAALPKELTQKQNMALVRDFVRETFASRGMVADWAYHDEPDNPHVHIMVTMRPATDEGFGSKQQVVTDPDTGGPMMKSDGRPEYRDIWGTKEQLTTWRGEWATQQNWHLELNGVEASVDHRSHAERGLKLEPTRHIGLAAMAMSGKGFEARRVRTDQEIRERNVESIKADPEQFLRLVTHQRATFTRRDIARELGRFVDDPQTFQQVMAVVEASPAAVELIGKRVNPATGRREPARFSTPEMIAVEEKMAVTAERLSTEPAFAVQDSARVEALDRMDQRIGEATGGKHGLTAEQQSAIGHMLSPVRLAAVVGYAGSGKSTILEAAREAWEAEGYRVRGATLSGIAAENLAGSGIRSQTLASFEKGLENAESMADELGAAGRAPSAAQAAFIEGARLSDRDVLVIDEAGMIGSRQMGRVLDAAAGAGAKVVLVGDAEQLPAIEAGAPFRHIAAVVNTAELTEIRRQTQPWAREATVHLATERTREALEAYHGRGHVHFVGSDGEARDGAKTAIVAEYMTRQKADPEVSRVVMAYTRADVADLNNQVRDARQSAGEIERGVSYQARDGQVELAPGDRLLFLANSAELGVRNGSLATVEVAENDRIAVTLDKGGKVSFDPASYQAFQHGYAATIHKEQGVTVDQSLVLASPHYDRHLTYVAMSRHRDQVDLYADPAEFQDLDQLGKRLGRSGLEVTTLDTQSEASPAPKVDLLANYETAFKQLQELDEGRQRGQVEVEVYESAKGRVGDLARTIAADRDYRQQAIEAGRIDGIEQATSFYDSRTVDPAHAAKLALQAGPPMQVFDRAFGEMERAGRRPGVGLSEGAAELRRAAERKLVEIAKTINETPSLRSEARSLGRLDSLERAIDVFGRKEPVVESELSSVRPQAPGRQEIAAEVRVTLAQEDPVQAYDQAFVEMQRLTPKPGASDLDLQARRTAEARVVEVARAILETPEYRRVAQELGRVRDLDRAMKVLRPAESSIDPQATKPLQKAPEVGPRATVEPSSPVESYRAAVFGLQTSLAQAAGTAGRSLDVEDARARVTDNARKVMSNPTMRATASLAGMVVTMKLFMRMFEPIEARGPGVRVEPELSAERKRQIDLQRQRDLDFDPDL